jgi:hypothetical protein
VFVVSFNCCIQFFAALREGFLTVESWLTCRSIFKHTSQTKLVQVKILLKFSEFCVESNSPEGQGGPIEMHVEQTSWKGSLSCAGHIISSFKWKNDTFLYLAVCVGGGFSSLFQLLFYPFVLTSLILLRLSTLNDIYNDSTNPLVDLRSLEHCLINHPKHLQWSFSVLEVDDCCVLFSNN